jgi:hypothetical protein
MKRIILIAFVFFYNIHLGFTQSSNVLVVPFGDRMFYNEATSQMLKESDFSYAEMINYFEQSLVSEIQKKGGRRFISCAGATTTGNHDDLKLEIRGLLDFYLAPISIEKRQVNLFGRPKSKLSSKKEKSEIKNGEEVSLIGENKTSYIASKVNSKRDFAKIIKEVGVSKVLVINEFDIREDMSSPYYNGNEHKRQIQVHYSIFDAKGKFLKGGVVVKNFSSSENNIKEIVKTHFPDLARQIVSNL